MIHQPDAPAPHADPNFSQPKSLIDLEFVPIVGAATSTEEITTDGKFERKKTGITQHESSVDLSYKPSGKNVAPVNEERDLILTHEEAQGGSPDDIAACGEEDIGSGLEFLVTSNDDHN